MCEAAAWAHDCPVTLRRRRRAQCNLGYSITRHKNFISEGRVRGDVHSSVHILQRAGYVVIRGRGVHGGALRLAAHLARAAWRGGTCAVSEQRRKNRRKKGDAQMMSAKHSQQSLQHSKQRKHSRAPRKQSCRGRQRTTPHVKLGGHSPWRPLLHGSATPSGVRTAGASCGQGGTRGLCSRTGRRQSQTTRKGLHGDALICTAWGWAEVVVAALVASMLSRRSGRWSWRCRGSSITADRRRRTTAPF